MSIELKDLMAFCAHPKNRQHLAAPASINGFTYATNGQVVVRVPGNIAPGPGPAFPDLEGIYRDRGIDGLAYQEFSPVVVPPPARVRCSHCSGHRHIVDCTVCEASGIHTCADRDCRCDHDCGQCNGLGVVPVASTDEGAYLCDRCNGTGAKLDDRVVDLGGNLAINLLPLQAIQRLPGPMQWSPPVPTRTERDRFDDGTPINHYGLAAFRGTGWAALIVPRHWHKDLELQFPRIVEAAA